VAESGGLMDIGLASVDQKHKAEPPLVAEVHRSAAR